VTILDDLDQANDDRYDALFDPATGLPKAPLCRDRLQTALQLALRSRGHVALFHVRAETAETVDVDSAMATVAGRMAGVIRPGDTVARVGERELAVVCQELRYEEDAAPIVERLLATIEPEAGAPPIVTVVALGLAVGGGGTDPLELIREAAAAVRLPGP
jgi:GGDEF domain-containing protein